MDGGIGAVGQLLALTAAAKNSNDKQMVEFQRGLKEMEARGCQLTLVGAGMSLEEQEDERRKYITDRD
jgi:hypothetical protein